MMSSTFTPVYEKASLNSPAKVSTTSQEWCGHTFTELKKKGKQYNFTLDSYFESEGIQKKSFNAKIPVEDGIWNTIRLHPESLPVGEFEMLPGTMFQRLRHTEMKPYKASAQIEQLKDDGKKKYHIEYPELNRTLVITYNASFPHEILGWEESYKSGFGPDAKVLTTKATKMKSIQLDYWTRNSVQDSVYRDSLNLK
jgi:hypothetical protein